MRSLLDTNVVIALLDSRHDFHERAQVTDIYLLGLATKRGERLVTFDARVTTHPVLNATQENLLHL